MKKKILSLFLVATLATTNSFTVLGSDYKTTISKSNIYIDGVKVTSVPLLINGSTYVPLRNLSETAGMKVDFDGKTNTINVNTTNQKPKEVASTNNSSAIKTIEKSNSKIYVNGIELTSDAVLVNGSTYVPLRNLTETAGMKVDFDNATGEININSNSSGSSDSEYYEFIENAYDNFTFEGSFVEGNKNDKYLKKYYELLNCQIPFVNKENGTTLYINEYNQLTGSVSKEPYNPKAFKDSLIDSDDDGIYDIYLGSVSEKYYPQNYTYYYYDIDLDGENELSVTDGVRFIYTFKYVEEDDEIILWNYTDSTSDFLMGSKQIGYSNIGYGSYSMSNLDSEANVESEISFYWSAISEEKTLFMINLPRYNDESKNILVPESIKNRGVQNINNSFLDYEVSEEEWNSLTEPFFEARSISEKNIKNVRYNYDTLFSVSSK